MPLIRSGDEERGAVLVLTIFLVVVLLGFAAFAVDLGRVWAVRRSQQTRADAAVLAAALEYLRPTPPTNEELVDLVLDYANRNATTPVADHLTLASTWAACSDPDRPAAFAPLTADLDGDGVDETYDCISLRQVSNEPTLLRVRLPELDVPTSFARLFGIDTIPVTAVAVAEIRYREDQDVLPFSLPADVQVGANHCLGTPPSGLLPDDEPPCSGPAQGNFGMIDSPWFGADDPHFTAGRICGTDPFTATGPHNLALGLDHLITVWPDPATLPADGVWLSNTHPGADSCANAGGDTVPYVLETQTGATSGGGASGPGIQGVLHDGLLGADPSPTPADLPGRLRQLHPEAPWKDRRLTVELTSASFTVDNVGLWEYLDFPQIPGNGPCASARFQGKTGRALTEELERCLRTGTGADRPRFVAELVDSPRFAVVPVLNYDSGDQFGNKWWAVKELRPVYLQSTWYRCSNGNATECIFHPDDMPGGSVFFNPGEGNSGPRTQSGAIPSTSVFTLQGLSAFVLDWDWFPPEVRNQIGVSTPYEVYLAE